VWGIVAVLLLPLFFLPLLGYAVSATRCAEVDPKAGPPPRLTFAHLWTGGWTAFVLLLITAPFALLVSPLSNLIDVPFASVYAVLILALPWGIVVLLWLPHATARFAATGHPQDLFDVVASLRGVRRDFATWNAVVAAIVTGWAIGLACVGVLFVGIVPGVFYAILVSAHAAAALHHPEGSRQSPSAG
jgi:hypothetical protein